MVLTRNRVGLTGTEKWSWIIIGEEPSGRFFVDVCRSSLTAHGTWKVNLCFGLVLSRGHSDCACMP
jgi:hypothetical protein